MLNRRINIRLISVYILSLGLCLVACSNKNGKVEQSTSTDETKGEVGTEETLESSDASESSEIEFDVSEENLDKSDFYVHPDEQEEFLKGVMENSEISNNPEYILTDNQTIEELTGILIDKDILVAGLNNVKGELIDSDSYEEEDIYGFKYDIHKEERFEIKESILLRVIASVVISDTVYEVRTEKSKASEETNAEATMGASEPETLPHENPTYEMIPIKPEIPETVEVQIDSTAETTAPVKITEETMVTEPVEATIESYELYQNTQFLAESLKTYELRGAKSLDGIGSLHGYDDRYAEDLEQIIYRNIKIGHKHLEKDGVDIYSWKNNGCYYSFTTATANVNSENFEEILYIAVDATIKNNQK